MPKSKSTDPVKVLTPTGRVINHSLFTKDTYINEKGQEAEPSYKLELAFSPDDIKELEAAIVKVAVAEWGSTAENDYWDGDIRSPLQDGDDKAKAREERGKDGDAYAGKVILRTHTLYNRDGEDGPGGVYVANAANEELDFSDQRTVYRGCFGRASITLSAYKVTTNRGVTAYLNGFQFVEDGERLRTSDPSSLFSPAVNAESASGKGRKTRRPD